MNFKEQYRSTFSEIRASEAMKKKFLETKNKEGKAIQLTKNKKKLMAILAAAVLAATSAVAVSAAESGAGAVSGALKSLRMYINGQEVSASDYTDVDGNHIKLDCDDGEIVIYSDNEWPEDFDPLDGAELTIEWEADGDTETHSVTIVNDDRETEGAEAEA